MEVGPANSAVSVMSTYMCSKSTGYELTGYQPNNFSFVALIPPPTACSAY